jgi:hypothetical protein
VNRGAFRISQNLNAVSPLDLGSEDAMAYDIPPPEKRPEPGFYYHHKHDPNGPLNNYAYYIYGAGHHNGS